MRFRRMGGTGAPVALRIKSVKLNRPPQWKLYRVAAGSSCRNRLNIQDRPISAGFPPKNAFSRGRIEASIGAIARRSVGGRGAGVARLQDDRCMPCRGKSSRVGRLRLDRTGATTYSCSGELARPFGRRASSPLHERMRRPNGPGWFRGGPVGPGMAHFGPLRPGAISHLFCPTLLAKFLAGSELCVGQIV